MQKTSIYPFSAIVGQQSFKNALLLVAIDPRISGVLVSGPRGTAKSTLARSLAQIMDGKGFINLPLGTSEEKLIGTLDLQQALQNQQVNFAEGLLAKAHNGILYVDEVNLLADHLVDILLDVAASGVNQVERDGISHKHPADFVLVGTMNPDEGELRPQLLDRFGLMVELQNDFTLEQRQQIMRQRLAFDEHPQVFCQKFEMEQQALIQQIGNAKQILLNVSLSDEIQACIAKCCHDAGVDGLRADITLYRAARAHAALGGQHSVTKDDIDAVKELVLRHRRNTPSQNTATSQQRPEQNNSNSGSSIQGSWGAMQSENVAIGESRILPEQQSSDLKKKP